MSGTITTEDTGGSSSAGPAAGGGRSMKSVLLWGAVAVVGAVCWGVLALARGETISALWLLFAALCSYAIAYRFYSRFITYKVLRADDKRATPAERLENGRDFDVTDRRVLFGHHFAAIAGAGPLVGPVLAAQMGYLPGTIWIVVGVIFAGAVQDMVVMFFSMRRNGKSLGQMVREEIGIVGGVAALIAVFAIMIIILAVLALIVVNALAESPWGVFSIALTIPIALFMGIYLRRLRPGQAGWLGKYCRIGPTPMSGAPTTVKQTTPRHGPSMRYVADLSDWDRSLMNVIAGQSGQPLSSHYKDQWPSYYVGQSFPMRFLKIEGGDTLQFVPQR